MCLQVITFRQGRMGIYYRVHVVLVLILRKPPGGVRIGILHVVDHNQQLMSRLQIYLVACDSKPGDDHKTAGHFGPQPSLRRLNTIWHEFRGLHSSLLHSPDPNSSSADFGLSNYYYYHTREDTLARLASTTGSRFVSILTFYFSSM